MTGESVGAIADLLDLPAFGERASLRQQVTEALRAAVITGAMRPGALYSAPTLAAKFGVSATPVREAMLDLAQAGLIEPVRNKGFRVTALSDQELDDITEIRALIEVPTVAAIAQRCEGPLADRVAELRPIAKQIVVDAERGDLIGYVESDRRFHLALLAMVGNAQLVAVVGELRSRSRLFGLQQLAERGTLAASAREHEELIDLVLARDTAGAAALMRRHIAHVRGTWAGITEVPE